jgi:TolB protein
MSSSGSISAETRPKEDPNIVGPRRNETLKLRPAFLLLLLCLLAALPFQVQPQEDWFRTGTGIGVEKVRLAVPAFAARSSPVETPTGVFNSVLWSDLEFSGILEMVSPSFYPLEAPSRLEELSPAAWAQAPTNAHMVAFGNVQAVGQQLVVEAWLSDVRNPQAAPVLAKRYRGELTEESARALAHQFADDIIERLSGGLPGIARTRIAFVSDRGGGKAIWVMDYDGHNQRQISPCGLCLTPRWSPDSTKIAFTAYDTRTEVPRTNISIHSLVLDRRVAFATYPGTTTTPAWSPDGNEIAFSSSQGGDQEIYITSADGGRPRRLTHSRGVDISPAWNRLTGKQIAFVSDRGGSPQIYLMDLEGGNVQRLTNGEGYAVSPAWSPNGQLLAFAWQRSGASFDIYVMDVATRQTVQLTRDTGRNEQPSWAPDGRHIVFQSTRSGRNQIWAMLVDGTGLRQLTFEGSNTGPNWSWK